MSTLASAGKSSPASRTSLQFFIGTFALLTVFKLWAHPHLDTARDILIARDCIDGARCSHAGAPSTFHDLVHGALWIRLLELRERIGLGLAALQRIVDLLLAGASAVIPILSVRAVRRRAGLLAWSAWIVLAKLSIGYPDLWGPTLTQVALVLFWWALMTAVSKGDAWRFAAAGLALGAALDLHVAFAMLVPLTLFVAVATSNRPVVAAAGIVVLPAAFVGAISRGAFAQNGAIALRHWTTVALVFVAACVAGWSARRFMMTVEPETRVTRATWIVCAGFVFCVVVGTVITGHRFAIRYLAPVVTPVAVLWCTHREAPTSRRRTAEVVISTMLVATHVAYYGLDRWCYPGLRLHEVEAVAEHLYRTHSFSSLYRHVRGHDAFQVIGVLAALEPSGPRPSESPSGDDILIAQYSGASTSPGEAQVGGAHLVKYHPFVQVDDFDVCTSIGMGAAECHRIHFDPLDIDGATAGGWVARAYPRQSAISRAFGVMDFGGRQVSYTLRLSLSKERGCHHIKTVWDLGELHWQIVRIDDVPFKGDVPGSEATVCGGDGGQGSITFSTSVPANRGFLFRAWLPPFVEIPESAVYLDGSVKAQPPAAFLAGVNGGE